MRKVSAYYGSGRGKTSAALGYAMQQAGEGKNVIVITFLKKKDDHIFHYLRRLEPEIRFFRFQKSEQLYEELDAQHKQDEDINMRNGLNYAHKVLMIGECDILILDELLGLLDYGILTLKELEDLIQVGDESVELILTGRTLPDELMDHMDSIYEIIAKK